MPIDMLRWSAISAVVFLVLAALWILLTGDVDLYADSKDWPEMLKEMDDNSTMMMISAIVGMVSAVFIFPVQIGLSSTFREEDRAFSLWAMALIGLAAVFITIAAVGEFLMIAIASDFVDATGAAADTILESTRVAQGMYIIFFYAMPLGVAMLINGMLMLRSGAFNKYFAWFTLFFGVAGVLALAAWFVFLPAAIIWFIAYAVQAWRKSRSAMIASAGASA